MATIHPVSYALSAVLQIITIETRNQLDAKAAYTHHADRVARLTNVQDASTSIASNDIQAKLTIAQRTHHEPV
ncbi:hypothetical protein BN2475_1530001 [Paraburkholderia ribeironis]|uniref:Uncharacterized protein n=1 Tax=Paraburkholderia ribeironis TaxID=1247936 RepID=A0A1N7SQD2_9BURK|nr:hypothetical protein BN2475_1530001 [Paraburkholderia ribeironis]